MKLHTQHVNVYHTCMRCGTDQPMSKMKWQNGLLVCDVQKCVDNAIVGKRDIDVARAMSIWRHELEPDRKLIEPTDRKIDLTEVLF